MLVDAWSHRPAPPRAPAYPLRFLSSLLLVVGALVVLTRSAPSEPRAPAARAALGTVAE